jgi:cytochrome c peroxidase
MPRGDLGRFQVTQLKADEYSFRSPSLRNIDLTPPYFHSGKVWNLEDAVALMSTSQIGTELKPEEVKKVVQFLKTLTGNQPIVEYPILPPNSDTTPRPVLAVDQKKH